MDLTSLTYTSLARLDLQTSDLKSSTVGRELNALDGITGLLIFNGTHFLQIVEGTHEAIDDLIERCGATLATAVSRSATSRRSRRAASRIGRWNWCA